MEYATRRWPNYANDPDHGRAVSIYVQGYAAALTASPASVTSPVEPTGPYSGGLRIPAGADLLTLSRQVRADAEQTRERHSIRTAYCAVSIDDLVRYTVAVEAALISPVEEVTDEQLPE